MFLASCFDLSVTLVFCGSILANLTTMGAHTRERNFNKKSFVKNLQKLAKGHLFIRSCAW